MPYCALGETTPGPLIMVVTFVGFVGGWTSSVFGGDSALMAAIVAAIITTIVTFLPSFLFILAGAPFVETTRDNLKFTAPLAAITAAVVGVGGCHHQSGLVFCLPHLVAGRSARWLRMARACIRHCRFCSAYSLSHQCDHLDPTGGSCWCLYSMVFVGLVLLVKSYVPFFVSNAL